MITGILLTIIALMAVPLTCLQTGGYPIASLTTYVCLTPDQPAESLSNTFTSFPTTAREHPPTSCDETIKQSLKADGAPDVIGCQSGSHALGHTLFMRVTSCGVQRNAKKEL